jgi:hypothetical protein
MIAEFLNIIVNHTQTMTYQNCELDSDKVTKYLAKCQVHSTLIKSIIDNTKYIDYDQFKSALFQSYDKFITEVADQEFYILVNDIDLINKDDDSEYYVLALLWDRLKSSKLKSVITPKTILPSDESVHILVLSDVLFDNNHLFDRMKDLMYFRFGKEKIKSDLYNFHILCPFVIKNQMMSLYHMIRNNQYMNVLTRGIKLHASYRMDLLSDLVNFTEDDIKILIEEFGITSIDLAPVYFDFYLGDKFTNFTSIYLEGKVSEKEKFGSLLTNPINNSLLEIYNLRQVWSNNHSS